MNIQNIVRDIKKEKANEKRRLKNRIKLSFQELKKIKRDFLKIDKNLEKMILFGSLAEDRIDSMDFDIDIAVKSQKYYQLVGRALQSAFKIDVIDLDSIHKKVKKSIIENGKVIYEKK